ncbi:maltoporin [Psychromonas ingrahamii 37]|uniref:Maltoporin n=1 Tax=Psychromonas ingrahamii (strain DSM 17664 / CCUG 51855 / 37) TaxID=357804 RepID=A1SSE2_PSYIN|nr:carbohydrate porin [Psychromonas ingrahamii]ABM02407.1 maltoporin [Psychromonas ingrahamii 37]
MKLSKITLACLLATSGLSVSGAANAGETEGFEFHGYFRAGVLTSAEHDFKQSNFSGQKETLGRLGIEADNDVSVTLAKTWAFDDDKKIKIVVSASGTDSENSLGTSADATHMGIGQTYVEFEGVSPSGTFWGGTRDYGKANYIFMTDFFYTDMSGTGIGVMDYQLGDTSLDFAYIASDRNDDVIDRWATDDSGNLANLNNLMHAFHLSATFGAFELSALLKAMPDNWDEDGTEYAETGFDLTAIYNLDSFFFMPGNGFSKIIAQGGVGLGSGNLLGGTITEYNAFRPGSLTQGQHDDYAAWHPSGGEATRLLTYVGKDDVSARVLLWGGYFFDNGIKLFPSIQGQWNDHEQWVGNPGFTEYWLSAMVRPIFPVSNNFFVATEFGAMYTNWNGASGNQAKATIAPTWIIGTGAGPAPEIRLLASYVNNAWNVDDVDSKSDIIVGLQADMWW